MTHQNHRQAAPPLKPIADIAASIGLGEEDLETYGRFKAKIRLEAIHRFERRRDASLILVSAMTPRRPARGKPPSPSGSPRPWPNWEGHHCRASGAVPGPVFGMKGGATGGGLSRVHPVDDINLHFTNDFHAVESAHNLLSAMVDNSVYHDNPLNLDPRKITWRRVLDMNDRFLRDIVIGLGGSINGVRGKRASTSSPPARSWPFCASPGPMRN